MSDIHRFWAKVKQTDACWEWIAGRSNTGYGSFDAAGRRHGAHRYSWQLHYGDIPSGLCVLHRCDNRACVRPDHLFLGTKSDNSRDMSTKGRHKVPGFAGEGHGASKLTDVAVTEILTSAAKGTELAEKFGVSASAISLVRRGKSWRNSPARTTAAVSP